MVPRRDHDRKDPCFRHVCDLKGFRDSLHDFDSDHCLSGTTDFHRALLRGAWMRADGLRRATDAFGKVRSPGIEGALEAQRVSRQALG